VLTTATHAWTRSAAQVCEGGSACMKHSKASPRVLRRAYSPCHARSREAPAALTPTLARALNWAGVPDVFRRHYAKWRAGAMAIGGDQTAHLLVRLRNGEAPQKNKVE